MASFGERLTNAIEAVEARRGGRADVVTATPDQAILKVTFPGINPRRPGGTEIHTINLANQNSRRGK